MILSFGLLTVDASFLKGILELCGVLWWCILTGGVVVDTLRVFDIWCGLGVTGWSLVFSTIWLVTAHAGF